MDKERENGKGIEITEPEELLVIVDKIKSVPKIKPSRLFRIRVAFYSLMPELALLQKRDTRLPGEASRPRERAREQRLSPTLRFGTAASMVLLSTLLVFSGLTLAASNSNPGDTLYSLKRARESLELAFTFDETKKIEKTLTFAETRLGELDFMIENDRLDPSDVKSVIEDYRSKTSTVSDALQAGELVGAGNLQSHYQAVKTAENNVEKRLAAAGPAAILKPAGDANVTVKDDGGGIQFEGGESSVSGTTGSKGKFSFEAEVEDPDSVYGLNVVVEADGRTAVVPAFRPIESVECGSYEANVSPYPGTLQLNQSETFTLTLTDRGAAAANLTVHLCDTTGTSSIDGRGNAISLETDANGKVVFEVTKTSVNQVSRITLDVRDELWNHFGEILAIGGVKTESTTGETDGKVIARTKESSGGAESIVLENGLVRLSVDGETQDIVTGISSSGNSASNGSITDPSVSDNGDDSVSGRKVSGPELTFSNADAAGYKVSYEVGTESSALTKTYHVKLKKGRAYAEIDCVVEAEGETAELEEAALDLYMMEFSRGSQVAVSGSEIEPPGYGSETIVDFKPGKPYATAEKEDRLSFLSCPAGSTQYPDLWVLGDSYLNMRLDPGSLRNGSVVRVSALVSATDPSGISELENEARENRGLSPGIESQASGSGSGFAVTTKPDYGDIKEGKQRFTITVYKEYEKLFD